jgi:hypothetical protein
MFAAEALPGKIAKARVAAIVPARATLILDMLPPI